MADAAVTEVNLAVCSSVGNIVKAFPVEERHWEARQSDDGFVISIDGSKRAREPVLLTRPDARKKARIANPEASDRSTKTMPLRLQIKLTTRVQGGSKPILGHQDLFTATNRHHRHDVCGGPMTRPQSEASDCDSVQRLRSGFDDALARLEMYHNHDDKRRRVDEIRTRLMPVLQELQDLQQEIWSLQPSHDSPTPMEEPEGPADLDELFNCLDSAGFPLSRGPSFGGDLVDRKSVV